MKNGATIFVKTTNNQKFTYDDLGGLVKLLDSNDGKFITFDNKPPISIKISEIVAIEGGD